jgi:hypothetical protein
LKLHGSVDWTLGAAAVKEESDYAVLGELLKPGRSYRIALPPSGDERNDSALRIRVLDGKWGKAWSFLSSRTTEPYMVTMARGKTGDIGPLSSVWRDAYAAISRAKRLEIVGYSMPDDDVEIRTLLRAGVRRAGKLPEIVVRNPAPDVHDRVRRFLSHRITSNYQAVDSL